MGSPHPIGGPADHQHRAVRPRTAAATASCPSGSTSRTHCHQPDPPRQPANPAAAPASIAICVRRCPCRSPRTRDRSRSQPTCRTARQTSDVYTAGEKKTIPFGQDNTAERTAGWRGPVFVVTTSAKKFGNREDDFAIDADDGRLIMTTMTSGGKLGKVAITRVYDRVKNVPLTRSRSDRARPAVDTAGQLVRSQALARRPAVKPEHGVRRGSQLRLALSERTQPLLPLIRRLSARQVHIQLEMPRLGPLQRGVEIAQRLSATAHSTAGTVPMSALQSTRPTTTDPTSGPALKSG